MMDTEFSISASLDPLIHTHPLHVWICLFFFLRVSLWGVNSILRLFFFSPDGDIMGPVVFRCLAESLEQRILQFPSPWLPGA